MLETPTASPHLGRRAQRVEDRPLLTGRGRFGDDAPVRAGTLHAAVPRSPHAHARLLAEGLAQLPGARVTVDMVRTNMVFFELADDVALSSEQVADRLRETANVWLGTNGPRGFRAVTHYWIDANDVQVLLSGLESVLAQS